MDLKALFNIGYGLYVVTSYDGERDNGLILNSVMQLTSEPARVPRVHPTHGATESPQKKRTLTVFSAEATAKISSVIKNPSIQRHIPLKDFEVFWERDIDINA